MLFRSFVVFLLLFLSLVCPITLQQIKGKQQQKPLFHIFFGPLSLARFRPERGQQPKTTKTTNGLFFLSCFASLLCCVSLSLCFTFFLLFLLYVPDLPSLFFVICHFFIRLVFLFLPPFPSNCKAAEEGKKRRWMKKTKIKQHEKQQTRQIRASRRWREINKHKPPPPPPHT